jgi:hypothetical protein
MTPGKIKVKRLKVSEPMVGISIRDLPLELRLTEALCRILAEKRVNLTFFSARQRVAGEALFGCVVAQDMMSARQAIEGVLPAPDGRLRIIPSVSLLSVFPHQSDFCLVGHLMRSLWDSKTRVHAMASSIAALTFVVDTECIETAVDRLEKCLDVPPDGRLT